MDEHIVFKFYTTGLTATELKSADGASEYFVEGYASTSDPDLVGDIVTPEALKSMETQIRGKIIKIDVEHESWKEGGSPNIIPVGKCIDARMDEKGLWIKVKLNSAIGRFKEVWESVKGGFLDAFSIAFTNVKAIERQVGGAVKRIISDLTLLNIALTGNPANPEARIGTVMAKSLEFATRETMPTTEIPVTTPPESPALVEIKTEPAAAAAPVVPSASLADLKALEEKVAQLTAVQTKTKNTEEQVTALTAQLKALDKALNTLQLKTAETDISKDAQDKRPATMVGPLDMFGRR
jgi:HK97 family phage prohead protease